MNTSSAFLYVTGGTLAPDAPSYVERAADRDLLTHLESGETCYVLNSRQMGKSSLCVRTIGKLRERGVRTVFCDLTKFGGRNLTAEQWYAALLSEVGRELNLRNEFLAYWKEHTELPPVQRLFGAITEFGLKDDSPVVVFIDEIDVTLSLPFSADEFFAAIRQCYVGRATDERLKRLSFCLLGTATPADLIQDTRVSPFNIGKRIELRDFTAQEAAPLATGLGDTELLHRVLHWTGGHPYLTQRLCQAVMESGSKDVDRVCSDLFLTHSAKEGDDNLAFVRNRLLKSEADLAALLDQYKKMRSGKSVPDDETNPLCALLKLSGVAKLERGQLMVRNRIYEHVFDRDWVETHMPDAEKRRQKEAYRRGVLRMLAFAAVAVTLVSTLAAFGFVSARRAQTEAHRSKQANEITLRNLYFAKMGAMPSDYDRGNFRRINATLAETKDSPYRGFEWGYWRGLASQDEVTLTGHTEDVYIARYSPRGDRILTASGDGTARIWGARTGTVQLVFRGHKFEVMGAAWAPDGEKVITVSTDKSAIIWDSRTGETLRTLAIPSAERGRLLGCCFSPDGNFVATHDGTKVKVWRVDTGKPQWERRIYSLEELAEGGSKSFFCFDEHQAIIELEWASGRLLHKIVVPQSLTMDVSPDGASYAIGGFGAHLKVVDRKGHLKFKLPVTDSVHACWSRDGKKLATEGQDNVVTLWDVSTRKQIATFHGHGGVVMSAHFSPDGRHVVTASGDGTAKVWSVLRESRPSQSDNEKGGYLYPGFSADSKRLLVTKNEIIADNRFHVSTEEWDAPFREATRVFYSNPAKLEYPMPWTVTQAMFTGPNNKYVLLHPDGLIEASVAGSTRVLVPARKGRYILLAGSARGERFSVTSVERPTQIELIDSSTGEIEVLETKLILNEAKLSEDGRWLAMHCAEREALVYDCITKKQVCKFEHKGIVIGVGFALGGNGILTACTDGWVRLWDRQTSQLIRTYGPVSSAVRSICVTPDGRRIVGGTDTGEIVLWDLDTGLEALNVRLPKVMMPFVAVSPDGRTIAVAAMTGLHFLRSDPTAEKEVK